MKSGNPESGNRETGNPSRTGETGPRGEKELPLHISRHWAGYRVEVRRGKLKFRMHTKDLAEALRMKEQFEAAAGPARVMTKARSNTGHIGISDTVKWISYRPRTVLQVQWQDRPGHAVNRRVHYGPRSRTKAEALRIAVGIRKNAMAALCRGAATNL